jgi:NAD(P)-dependent dehydrogenase (short-subunit alcohol dehydrogenase family)
MTTHNKVAVITGGGTGIGKATALAFVKDGYRVVITGRRPEPLDETIQEAGVDSARMIGVPTDVGDPAAVKNLFAKTIAAFGRVDVLFNNAGSNAPGVLFEDLSWEKWKAVVDANLNGMFLCSQEAYKIMKDQKPMGGRIINNGSISAHVPRPDSAPYTATKHGVSGLTRTIALDGRKYDIACCQVDVGNAMSTLASRMAKGVKQANGTIAPEPMITCEDVARSVLFMANQPPEVNIYHLMVMATKMPYAGRG